MSKGAVKNSDRRRELREQPIPRDLRKMLEPGTRAYRMGRCQVLVSIKQGKWHLSISTPERLPTWEECRDARYELIPDEVTMALLLPPRGEYVNVHDFCLQMYEIDPLEPERR